MKRRDLLILAIAFIISIGILACLFDMLSFAERTPLGQRTVDVWFNARFGYLGIWALVYVVLLIVGIALTVWLMQKWKQALKEGIAEGIKEGLKEG